MKQKNSLFVRKPNSRNEVVVMEGISPLSKIVETIPCRNHEIAWQTYRQLKKDQGKML